MNGKKLDPFYSNLASIGCAWTVEFPKIPADPEKTVLDTLQFFWSKPKIFNMLVGVLYYRIHDIIHVDRLISLAQDIPSEEKIILKAISQKITRVGDKRYRTVINKLSTGRAKVEGIPKDHSDPYLVEKYGLDEDFLKFKVKVLAQPLPAEKKYFNRESILVRNPWLRLRALIGPNYRADITYLRAAKIANTPVEAYSVAGCTRAVAYTHWRVLSQLKDIEKLVA